MPVQHFNRYVKQERLHLAAKTEEIMSMESPHIHELLSTISEWTTSVTIAYYHGQLVAIKNVNKSTVTLNKLLVMEVNQVYL